MKTTDDLRRIRADRVSTMIERVGMRAMAREMDLLLGIGFSVPVALSSARRYAAERRDACRVRLVRRGIDSSQE